MINVITRDNAQFYPKAIDTMFRDRKRVFVDLMKWQLPLATATHERDQFDNDDAIYLVGINPADGTHMASMRLLPTASPHILGDIFPDLCEDGPPRADDIFEVTRFCPSPRVRDRNTLMACRLQLGLAMIEFGLLYGIARYTACMYGSWLSKLMASGWRMKPLGPLRPYENDAIGGVEIEVSQRALGEMRAICNQLRPVLNWYRDDGSAATGERRAA